MDICGRRKVCLLRKMFFYLTKTEQETPFVCYYWRLDILEARQNNWSNGVKCTVQKTTPKNVKINDSRHVHTRNPAEDDTA